MSRILIIDTDTYICELLQNYLKQEGHETEVAYSGKSARKILDKKRFNLVLCEYHLPDVRDFELVEYIRQVNRDTTIIIMTAYAKIRTAVKAIKMGAFDYVSKPVYPDEIRNIIKKALDRNKSNGSGTRDTQRLFKRDFVIGKNKQVQEVMNYLNVVAPTNMTVLIQGETGSGKEHIARAIHYKSKRKNNPFIPVDCGAIPKELANSELFGHVKGAFTGASRNKRGYFELANKGTLFLDEIGNLQPDIQVKLLRAIQEKVVMRMGSEKSLHIDVRIIVAANEDLREKVNKGSFREDLFHRINAFRLYLPSLRDRMEDIDIFINHFISKANKEFDKQIEGITAEFKEIIHKYSWPGNIRELENIIRRCVLLESGRLLTASTLPDEIVFQIEENIDSGDQLNSSHGHELKNAVNFAEKEAILEALRRSDNNKTAAARMLKIDRKTLYNKLKKYDLNI